VQIRDRCKTLDLLACMKRPTSTRRAKGKGRYAVRYRLLEKSREAVLCARAGGVSVPENGTGRVGEEVGMW
jgi:hypothetical protein